MSADPGEYAITIDGLVNAVGPGQILHKDLNLQVRRDEVMTLVGGSGSGKTQLLRVIRRVEAEAVAGKLGVTMPIGVESRIDGAASVGEHKTSMLQDFERGRPIELDAIVGAVAELGDMVGVDTPMVDAIYALTRRKAVAAGILR